MINKSYTNEKGVPFYAEYTKQGIPLKPIPQHVSQDEIDNADTKDITITTVPLCLISPSQTHISISQMNKDGQTVKLSKSMRYFAAGGSWDKVFNVVSMKKKTQHGKEEGQALVTPHNRSLFALSTV